MTITEDSAKADVAILTRPSPAIDEICHTIAREDLCILAGRQTKSILLDHNPKALADWDSFQQSWDDMPLDGYINDGGRYRRRRFSTLRLAPFSNTFEVNPPRGHYQSLEHNHLNGGILRLFEPVPHHILRGPTMAALLRLGGEIVSHLAPYSGWHVEVHQFRIEADGTQISAPTPEGRHRDGVAFVMMAMVRRTNVTGGVTTLYTNDGQPQAEVTLRSPLDLVLVNDEHTQHEVSRLLPAAGERPGFRDVLVATFAFER